MAINLSSNFLYQAKEFLDGRQGKAGSKSDLKSWNIPIPDGFEVFCSEDVTWYTYRPEEDEDPETGKFHIRIGNLKEDLEQKIQEVDLKTIENAENIHDLQVQNQVLVADTQDDLLNSDNWIIDGVNYAKKGIIVSVNEDVPGKNGIYRLKADDYTSLDNWDKVSDDVIWVGETEPNQRDYIWIDQSGAYTSTTVNSDVADLIRAVQNLQKEVSDIKYAFSHEISFGDFTNNVKSEVEVAAEPLEPGTTETTQTVKVPMPNGTVTTITTIDRINIRTDDTTDLVITTITKITDSKNSGGWEEYVEDIQTNFATPDSQEIVEWTKSHSSIKTEIDSNDVIWNYKSTVTSNSAGESTQKYSGIRTEIENGIDDSTGDENKITTTIELTSTDGENWEEIEGTKVITTETWYTEIIDDNTKKEEFTTKILYADDYGKNIIVEKTTKYDPIDDVTVITTVTRTVDYMIKRNEDGTSETIIIDDKTETETTSDEKESITTYTPNAKHIRIKCGKYNDMMAMQSSSAPFLSGELLYCYDKNWLYIITPDGNIPVRINTLSEEAGGKVDLSDVDKINFNTTLFNSKVSTKYTVKVSGKGELECYPSAFDTPETPPDEGIKSDKNVGLSNPATKLYLQKLYINSLYCGGLTSDKYSYNYCSHNFVELSNLTKKDIVLDGLSLQYSVGETSWKCLPLHGVIKSKSTFLIRGGQCSVIDSNTTLIKVKDYDMEWYDFDNNEMIKFSSQGSKFLLIYGTEPCTSTNPFIRNASDNTEYCEFGYIDSVGLKSETGGKIDGFEIKEYTGLSNTRLFTKYYSMDPVKQATKAISARNNSNDWYYVELSTANTTTGINGRGINVFNYVPKSSKENKNIFYNKSKLSEEKPNLVTVSFGIKATDYGQGATRCFNWVSKNYYDEFLRYKIYKIGEDIQNSDWITVESFSPKDGTSRVDRPTAYQDPIYNRQRVLSTSEESFTSHKYILTGLRADRGKPVTYKYQVGGRSENDTEHWSDEYTFKILNYQDAQEFSFIQTSDQQGFRLDEYIVWQKSAEAIKKKEIDGILEEGDESYTRNNDTPALDGRVDFTINTGDMTQNGNRLNEWIDYYDAGCCLWKELEQMNVIGNNDLCPAQYQGVEGLGEGEESDKINAMNFQFFYTYEFDPKNRPYVAGDNGVEKYIHSLYSFDYGSGHFIAVHSEVTVSAMAQLYNNANVYERVREWLITDLGNAKTNPNTPWLLSYCHEMPFTIITDGNIKSFKDDPKKQREGSHLNTVLSSDQYWFSRLLEIYGVPVCFGGHKHTYSSSRAIRENYTYTWEGQARNGLVPGQTYDSAELYPYDLVTIGTISPEEAIRNVKMDSIQSMTPIIQLQQGESQQGIDLTNKLGIIERLGNGVNYYTAPIYVMCQATGYKHTSNKELPGKDIPWLSYYYVNQNNAANPNQKFPFYIKWTVTPNYIRGDAYKIENIFNSAGKFNINNPNTNSPIRRRGNGDNTIIIKKRS